MSEETAQLTIGTETHVLPIRRGSLGPSVIDVSRVHTSSKMFAYDPGFTSTASCESKITYVDGDAGVLLYRGYPIEQLADHGDFLEVCYLLLHGELPTESQRAEFERGVAEHIAVHEKILEFFQGFRRDAHPMAVMVGTVGALSAFYHDSLDISRPEQRVVAAVRMLAKVPTLAAMAFKYAIGQPFIYPSMRLDFASNLLRMCFAVPAEEFVVNPVLSKALDRILILHADHGQGTSTSTVRLAGSSGANPLACIATGIASLWGPIHGGANEATLQMLQDIGTPDRISKYIARAKDRNDPFRLLGFGHRVYNTYDPRAKVLQRTCHQILESLGRADDPLLQTALELERVALQDEFFIERNLFPNIDLYSGIALNAIGFPSSMFTALFAVARSAGWLAHWKEMTEDPSVRIARPRQLYTGAPRRAYVEKAQRG